jgi:hypothetical protein
MPPRYWAPAAHRPRLTLGELTVNTPRVDSELTLFLRQEMHRYGYNQSDLARRAGLTTGSVSQRTPRDVGKKEPVPLPDFQFYPALVQAVEQVAFLCPEHQDIIAHVMSTLAADLTKEKQSAGEPPQDEI